MRHQQDFPSPSPGKDIRNAFIVYCQANSVMSRGVVVFARHQFGRRYLGWGCLLTPVVATFWGQATGKPLDALAMTLYVFAYLLALLVHQINQRRRDPNRDHVHSRYVGDPRLARFFPGWELSAIRLYAEPVVFGMISCMLFFVSPALGSFLLVATMSLHGEERMMRLRDQRIVEEMRDRIYEQQLFVEQLHGGN